MPNRDRIWTEPLIRFVRFMPTAMLIPVVIVVVSFAWFVVCGVRTYFLFDRLLRIQITDYRDEWLGKGSPCGYFWFSPTYMSMSWSAQRARDRLFGEWYRTPPRWADECESTSKQYANWRKATKLSYLSLGIFLASLALPPIAFVLVLIWELLKLKG